MVAFLMEKHDKKGAVICLIMPGQEPDRNLLSMFSRRVLEWVVDFAITVGVVKAIVCFDCVSTACQQRW